MKFYLVFMLLFSSMLHANDAEIEATLDRSWGLMLGDIITMQVTLPVSESEVDQTAIPQIHKRYGTWLLLEGLTIEQNQLKLLYQVVNVPPQTQDVTTPEMSIRTLAGEYIELPELPMTLSPILAKTDSADAAKMKDNHQANLLATASLQQRVLIYVLLTLLGIAAISLWHYGWRPKNRKPFAQAVHDLSRLRWQRNAETKDAVRIMHAAFNKTAETTLVYSDLATLFDNVAWLQPLEKEITDFYQQSTQHFFSKDSSNAPELAELRKLAKACRAREKLA